MLDDLSQGGGSFADPTGDISGIDADALMNDVEAGRQTAPEMQSAPEPEAPAQQQPEAQSAAAQAAAEYEITRGGQTLKVPSTDPRVKQWLQQGYDYAQRMSEFNRQQQEFQSKESKLQELASRYSPVEEYIEKNPQWWAHVNQAYQQAQQTQGQQPAAAAHPEIQAVKQELSQVSEFIRSQQAKEAEQRQLQEDQQLDQDIKSVRDSFKDMDWVNPGESGKTLELRVLEHMQQNGISKFSTAFRDLMHEDLVKRAEERGKEAVVKERQKQTKLGLLGKTPAPKAGLSDAQDYRNKSYGDLLREGAEELGIKL